MIILVIHIKLKTRRILKKIKKKEIELNLIVIY